MNFFFDNNLPKRLARALDELDSKNHVEHLQARFSPDAQDRVWLGQLNEEGGWAIITKDLSRDKNPDERRAWRECKLPILWVAAALDDQGLWEMSAKVVKAWPSITDALSAAGSQRYVLSPNGKVRGVD